MIIPANSKLLFIGDSITDADRKRPVGEGLFDPYGKGYVSMVEALLTSTYPERAIRVANVGISGNTVKDLKARWQTDVLDQRPTHLSIMIGINDVWRQFDSPKMAEWHVLPDEYEIIFGQLLDRTRPAVSKMILMTPFYIEPNRSDAMRKRMDEYGAIAKKLAKYADAVVVDVQAAFDEALKHMHSSALSWDRVHPNQAGHMIMARAWLKAVGYQW